MKKIAIIGLGYVGLPLAVEFGKNNYKVIGFDINKKRIIELNSGRDHTLEVSEKELELVKDILFTSNPSDLENANIYIITVPTPIDKFMQPDLTPIISASKLISKYVKKGDIIIYESTVFPGCTEEVCVPIIEEKSGLKFNQDFYCGYSPERINPGDKEHRVQNIVKVTSGSTPEIADKVDNLYKSIIIAGTHKASSIRIAEAAKVIENTQRDINIAFVNELAKIFNRLNIDTHAVLEAASTKWNFLPFKPGLVGGHCIGVDPYYLAQKAQEAGYHPEIILAGRRINDSMGDYVATEVLKLMVQNEVTIKGARVLILGITFKENCPDIRNTRVIDIYKALKAFHMDVEVYDPWASCEEVKSEYGIDISGSINGKKYNAIVHTVAHNEFLKLDLKSLKEESAVVYDVKGSLSNKEIDKRL